MTRSAHGPELIENPPAEGLPSDYRIGSAALAPFFSGHPWTAAAWDRQAARVAARFGGEQRARLTEFLTPTNAEARRRLDAIASGEGFVVTTGQQAGALGGPLFTLYKALTAVAVAEALQAHLGVPVLAVFWVASEDHDWTEVRDVALLDPANELRTATLDDDVRAGGTGPSMARRPLPATVDAFLDAVADALPPTDFRDDVLRPFREAYRAGASVSDAFGAALAALFAGHPLAMTHASDPALKRASVPVLRTELERGDEHERVLRRTTLALEQAGYEPQVPIADQAENLFYEHDGSRERLMRAADGWITRGAGTRLERGATLAELEREPVRFSPNVLLRPVVESAILPTLAYVAGPSELRYFAQIGCLFAAHGIDMPLVVPRASFTVVEGKVRKVLDKFDLALDDLALPPHELAGRVASEAMPDAVEAAVRELRAAIGAGYDALNGAVQEVDPTLKGPLNHARSAAFRELGDLEKRVLRQLKAQNEVTLEQIEKARINLFPRGKSQERVLNALQYLTRYGRSFIDDVRTSVRFELDGDVAWNGPDC